MSGLRLVAVAVALAGTIFSSATRAGAEDVLRFASAAGGWDNQVAPFGVRAGIFKQAGIDLLTSTTDGSAPTLQALISGAVDVGVVSVPAFVGAAVKGAPLTMISSSFRGSSDSRWLVRMDSPIKSLSDVTPSTKLGYSVPGSSDFILLSALLNQYGVTGTMISTGNPTAGMAMVMSGQLDIGYDGNGGLGVPEFERNEVRIIAEGRELATMQDVTVRGLVVTRETLAAKYDILVRFLQAYQATVDWMYSNPEASEWLAEVTHSTQAAALEVIDNQFPKSAMQLGQVAGIEGSIDRGIAFNRIEREPTSEELGTMFEIIWEPSNP